MNRFPSPFLSIPVFVTTLATALAAHAAPVTFDQGLRSAQSTTTIGDLAGPDDLLLTTSLDGAPWTSKSDLLSGPANSPISAHAFSGVSNQSLSARAQASDASPASSATSVDANAYAGSTFLGIFNVQAGQLLNIDLDLDFAALMAQSGSANGDLAVSLKLGDDDVLDQDLTSSGHYHWSFALPASAGLDAGGSVSGTLGLSLSAYAATLGQGNASLNGSALFSVDAQPVPEPQTAWLLLAGLAGTALFKRKLNAKTADARI